MYSSQQSLLKVTLECIKKQPKQHGLIPGQLIFANARREPDPRTGEGHTSYLLGKMDGWEGRDHLICNALDAVRDLGRC